MVSKPFLRIILSLLFCLNGSTVLWASTGMALDPAHMQPAAADADDAGHLSHDSGCDLSAETCALPAGATDIAHASGHDEDHDHDHDHGTGDNCWCGIAAGCSCNCAHHGGMTAHSVPLQARHRLLSTGIPYAEVHAPRRGSSNIFRPPIG